MRLLPVIAALLIASANLFAPVVQGAVPLPDAVQACTKERDDARRLACFDREVARATARFEENVGLSASQERKLAPASSSPPASTTPAAVTTPPAPVVTAASASAPEAPQPPAPPIKKAKKTPNPPLVSSTVSQFSRNPDGRYLIGLANGQTWIQGEAWEIFDVRVGDTVTIRPGLFGSFHMDAPSGSETRVTRAR